MSKPNPPAAPDYQGAALQQGQQNIEAARAQGQINNPNVVNPYGTQTTTYGTGVDQPRYDQAQRLYQQQLDAWQRAGAVDRVQIGMSRNQPVYRDTPRPKAPSTWDYVTGDPNQLTLTQRFSPEQQALYDQQTSNQQLLGGLGTQGINAAQGVIGRSVDYSGAPAMPGSSDEIRQQVYDAMMQRPNEDIAVQRDNANSQLTSAGIPKDSLAYQNAMRQIDRQENDARNQAVLSGGVEAQRNYGMDIQSRQQGLNEYNAARSIPLNEITALMSGSQVSNPFQMPGYAQNAQVAPAPTYAATNAAGQYGTDVYNQRVAQQGNLQSGLFGLGGTAIMGGAMM